MEAICNIYIILRVYKSYEELAAEFAEGKLHPGDLKPAVARVIN